jgi:hypothetical protein
MMGRLGMKQADLRKRGDKLAELRARLAAAPQVSKPRATMKAPEPYVLEVGVLYACPVQGSSCINPYRAKKNHDGSPWIPDGWRQFVILNRGRAFDYLAWYHPLVTKKPVREKPRLSDATADLWWELDTPKTCPRRQFDRMEIAAIGTLPIDMEKARDRFAKRKPGYVHLGADGRSWAVNEVTIADTMHPSSHDWERWYGPKGLLPQEGPTMMRNLGELLVG